MSPTASRWFRAPAGEPKPWRYSGTVHGIAVDKASGEPLAGVLVSASNTRQATSGADGRFVLEQVPAGLAVVSGSHPDYMPDTEAADLVAGERVEVRLELEAAASTSERLGEQLDQQGKVDLYGIYFDTDKATLKDESTSVLEQVRALLEARPQLQLVVAGHTDAEGGDDHNMALSARRAEAVVAWLGEHGIDVSRLRAEGHGESRPVANNATGEGRALNRRVEIRDAAGD
ncbi:MAG: OmpA family protein [Thermomonas sp.]|nr:OmpA family protein [Thermomonas sp.]